MIFALKFFYTVTIRWAYPDSVKERERHLRRKFRNSVPKQTLDKLENALSSFSLFGEVLGLR